MPPPQSLGRIAFVAAYPHVYGGTERALQLLAAGLQERGWNVDVVLPWAGLAVDRFRAAGLSVEVLEAPAALRVYGGATRGRRAVAAGAALAPYWARLRRRFIGTDLVHAFTQRAVVLAGPAARLAGARLVWQVGGGEPSRVLNHLAARLAHVVIAVSPSAAAGLPAAARPVVVPNAVDPAAFGGGIDAATLSPLPPPGDGVHVVCAARLTPEKGVDVLVRAAALLARDVPGLRVLVLGDTQTGHEAHRAELVALADRLGVGEVVCFAGHVDQPFRRWAGARVYVQPSHTEGFGLALAEAMASGLPVVATAVGGVPELLDDGRAGRLVPPDDPQALATAVRDLLRDPAGAARLAGAGRARVQVGYTVDAMVDGVEAVYRRLVGERPSRE
ncbi:MAG: glycosyltransferase family 4 protein [Acidimicrobiia bacterium]|nr:glycosyltransferase family 4 protein [Acidimicrobiia bacterium]